jgi:hypothetical protein
VLQDLFELAERLAGAERGEKVPLIDALGRKLGKPRGWIYRRLREHAGFRPERKKRSDAGTTRLPANSLHFIAASVSQGVRNNGISTKPICVAMNIAHENGLTVNVSPGRMAALMRARHLDVKTQAVARNHLRQRSLYPNHVHQIDPSLCLVYYMDGKQHVMREQEFNKNKPCAIEKVKLKVWRYVRYDHASGTLDVRYFEAAGENQVSLFEFMVHTWGRQAAPGEPRRAQDAAVGQGQRQHQRRHPAHAGRAGRAPRNPRHPPRLGEGRRGERQLHRGASL